jgi:spermidine synthase
VLINGLGLGLVLYDCAIKPEVNKVTVIEIDKNIIELVGSQYQSIFGDKIEIVNADALEYIPPKGVRYDCAWHDIWDVICLDNWEEYKKLHRKYGRRCNFQDSWCREHLKDELRKSKSSLWY